MTARYLAARCLCEVLRGGYSNLVFKQRTAGAALNARDTAFAAAVFYGALERAVTLEWILEQSMSRSIEKLDAEVRAILLCGLYQALYMDGVPVRAAVSESVALCGAFKKRSAASFVNAVLRRASEFDMAELEKLGSGADGLAIRYAVRLELAELLLEQYGDRAESILAATLDQTPTALRVNALKIDTTALAALLAAENIITEPGSLGNSLLVLSGRYPESSALSNGLMRVQSIAAQFAVEVLDPQPGQSLLDLCAAPGGKALTAAQRMENRGHITALDRNANRLALVEQGAVLEGVQILTTAVADATSWQGEELFDRVLCDVPCSGFGELAKKPELRQKQPDDSDTLPALQGEILRSGARNLKPGGKLVYATCTLNVRENEDVVAAFLAEQPRFVARSVENLPSGAEKIGDFVKFVPQKGNSEGFFIACLERMW